jgi:hypothetical protein
MVLLDYIIYLHWRRRQRRRNAPSTLSSSTAAGHARFLSTLITRGCGLAGSSKVLRKSRLAAAGNRWSAQWNPRLGTDISIPPFDPDVGFIDAIASIGAFQVRAAAFVQFRPVDLDPISTGVDEQTPQERDLGHLRE